jgi:hypothetical protein
MSAEMRPYGWALVGILVVAVIVATIYKPRPKKPLEPLPHEMEQLRAASEVQQPALLAKVKKRLLKHDPAAQVMVLQAAPNGPPVITWNVDFDSDDEVEEPTHWPAPWPAVVRAMAEPIKKPTTVPGKYHGGDYRHRLIPLDETGQRLLLVNSSAPAPVGGACAISWRSARSCSPSRSSCKVTPIAMKNRAAARRSDPLDGLLARRAAR